MSSSSTYLQKEMFAMLELLRNASIVSGNSSYATAFRQDCSDKAYHILCTSIIPELVELKLIVPSEQMLNLCDVGAMYQKKVITRISK